MVMHVMIVMDIILVRQQEERKLGKKNIRMHLKEKVIQELLNIALVVIIAIIGMLIY